ncbi:ubiquitin carboxy terminal hydrolase Ubp4 [Schizosaccharomyces cryophilus OY26]|uniref:Ubiquitin carboxyl-terminal hydrolase n=1 Tax=Schizosaccharomyces cryophilus (strain OY26 / ATCC MYA-4695 / CBS 11777 / NBRC 106824 / NRRL Y48691) TaxID=653667 RepID=S9W4T7_SCHCR|nr:ubiquitin carboxy terminal hydrolase Ubp4 [Schizosaccharomyces cryophilus OY26]EPY52935.1 ubiquitin carboxy terminal hydrolase Ubp4 [Schizosaccharomyces cryophilus OY26]
MSDDYFDILFDKAFVYIHDDETVQSCTFRGLQWLEEAINLEKNGLLVKSYIYYLKAIKLAYEIPCRFEISVRSAAYPEFKHFQKQMMVFIQKILALKSRLAVKHFLPCTSIQSAMKLAKDKSSKVLFLNIYSEESSKEYSFSDSTICIPVRLFSSESVAEVHDYLKRTPFLPNIVICYSIENYLEDIDVSYHIYSLLISLKWKPQLLISMSNGQIDENKNIPEYLPIGLTNLGNTCYMNCVLQCIFACRELIAPIYQKSPSLGAINTGNPLGSGGKMTFAFHSLVKEVFQRKGKRIISPKRFLDIVQSLNRDFSVDGQCDAQEFLNFVLDKIHEDLNSNASRIPIPPLSDVQLSAREKLPLSYFSHVEWNLHVRHNLSIVEKIFSGQLCSRIQCTVCQRTSTTFAPFTSLAIPIPDVPGFVSLHECLRRFMAFEVLEGHNAWCCPVCQKQRPAKKIMNISHLSDYLIIQIQRFRNTMLGWKKIDTPLQLNFRIPSNMLIPPCFQSGINYDQCSYDLFAFVSHYGQLENGHYTSNVFSENQWYRIDDSIVQRVDGFAALQYDFSSSYILFYKKKEGISELEK